jgi:hypothetical protein
VGGFVKGAVVGALCAGRRTSADPKAYGVAARTASTSAPALSGTASSSGMGVFGQSDSGTGSYGRSTSGIGLFGLTASTSLPAVQAQNTGGGPAGLFSVTSGVAPFTVTRRPR